MDKLLIRKDVYEDMIEKGDGKRDLSKLTKKQITDKNGHKRTVYVRNGEQPATQNQPKIQDDLTPEKKARYEEMLEKVKAGSDENALFVRGKGMLNKKDAIAHLEGKLNSFRSQQKEKESYEYNRDIRDFYDRTGLKGGMYEALARNEAATEERKEDKLKAGNRDDSSFKENDKVEFSRNGKYLNGTKHSSGEEESSTDSKTSKAESKKSSKELNKEMEDLRSEYREKYDNLSKEEIDNYVKRLKELEDQVDKAETEETGMNKFERRGYDNLKESPWLDKNKLPMIKEDAEAEIKRYENLIKYYKKNKSKYKDYPESYEVNLAVAQDNMDEYKGKLKAINEMMSSETKKSKPSI